MVNNYPKESEVIFMKLVMTLKSRAGRILAGAVCVMLVGGAMTGCSKKEVEQMSKDLNLGRELTIYEKDIVQYANNIKDTIKMGYEGGHRNYFTLQNPDVAVESSLVGERGVSSIGIPGNTSITSGAAQMVVKTKDGAEYTSYDSTIRGRMNTYSHGLYYYDTHLLDLKATNKAALDGARVVQSFSFDDESALNDWGTKSNSELSIKDGALVFKSTGNGQDEHSIQNDAVNMNVFANPDDYNKEITHVRLKIKTTEAFEMIFDWQTAAFQEGKLINVEQAAMRTSAAIAASDDFRTYYIDLSNHSQWIDVVKMIKFKLNSKVGTEVLIDSIDFINLIDYEYPVNFDFGYYMYPNKLHEQNLLRFSDNIKDLESAFSLVKVNESEVESVVAIEKDASDVKDVTEEVKAGSFVDKDNLSAIMFKTKKGNLGYIFPEVEDNGKIDVVIENEEYNFRHYVALKESYESGDGASVARRVIVQKEYDEEALKNATYVELNPLTEKDGGLTLAKNKKYKSELFEYNAIEGYYEIGLEGRFFQPAYDEPSYGPETTLSFKNDGYNREIYVKGRTTVDPGCLEAAVVLDNEKRQLPVKVQVSKNFCGENEEVIYRHGDPAFGDSYYPIQLAAEEEISVTTKHLFQAWGTHNIKQVSSILFWTPYYHLSTGCTETTCWSPLLYNSKNGFMICDYRGWSNDLWEGQPQHDTIGEHYLFRYKSKDGTEMDSVNYYESDLKSVGPNYSDFTMKFHTDDGKADVNVRSVELSQTDETRVYTSLKVTFNEDLTIENARENFSLYDITGNISGVKFAQAAYLNDNNEVCETTTAKMHEQAGDGYAFFSMGEEKPFFAWYECLPGDANQGNCGAVVDSFTATADGKKYGTGDLALAVSNMQQKIISFGDGQDSIEGYALQSSLTIDTDTLKFKKGDTIECTLLLSPYGNGEDKTSGVMVEEREKLLNNPFTVSVDGKEVDKDFAPIVKAKDEGETVFSTTGGDENMAVKIEGYTDYIPPKVYRTVEGGTEEEVVLYTEEGEGKDGNQAYVTDDGKYGFVLLVSSDGKPATYRVVK